MSEKTELSKLKMKLSFKKETLRTIPDSEQALDGVVGGTCVTTGCPLTADPVCTDGNNDRLE